MSSLEEEYENYEISEFLNSTNNKETLIYFMESVLKEEKNV